jgi:predicted nucleic acid-binding protein
VSVTLDTNIYVAALEFGGIGARLLGMARAGLIQIDVSDAILDELVGVLRDDFGWDGYRLHFAREQLAALANRVTPARILDVVGDDPADNRILECALEAGSECIVTEDKDRRAKRPNRKSCGDRFQQGNSRPSSHPPGTNVLMPAAIEKSVWEYFAGKAEKRGIALSELLTEVLKRDIGINEALK